MTKLNIVLLVPLSTKNGKSVKKICCQGVVVRKESFIHQGNLTYYIAIFFNEIEDKDRKQLVSYVNSQQKSTSPIPQ